MSFDLYQTVTDQIIAMLEQGIAPWRSPILGSGSAGHPKSMSTGNKYRGVNIFLLAFTAWAKGYGSSFWMTFREAKERGGTVKKGEKSSMVVFWKQYETKDRETGDPTTVPIFRYYNVFNAEQIEGIQVPDVVPFTPLDFQPIAEAEKLVAQYADGPTIEHAGSKAFYAPKTDSVQVPDQARFKSSEEYYSTLLHELAHSTGHSKRLNRKIDTEPHAFGTPEYGFEELVAETAAAFLCSQAGIQPVTIENQAAYIAGWLQQIKKDKTLVIKAASKGQKAADWILGQRQLPE